MTFSLNDTITEILDHTDLTDPTDIAELLAIKIPEDEVHEVLLLVLRDYVRVFLTKARRSYEPALPPRPSSKVAGIRDFYKSQMRKRYSIKEENGTYVYKMFGNLTAVDLASLIAERRANAEHNLAVANQLEALAKALAEYGVERVEQLPPDVVSKIMRGQG